MNPNIMDRYVRAKERSQSQYMNRDIIPKGYRLGQLQQFTPEQMDMFRQLMEYYGPDSFLAKLMQGDESAFEEMEAPALRQFGQLQGNLASRFSGMGAGGRYSSGFQNMANQQASDFAQSLMSQRNQIRDNAQQNMLQGMSSILQQRPFERMLQQKGPKPGALDYIKAVSEIIGNIAKAKQ